MKRFSMIVALALTLGLTACGNASAVDTTGVQGTSTSQQTEVPEKGEVTPEPTENPVAVVEPEAIPNNICENEQFQLQLPEDWDDCVKEDWIDENEMAWVAFYEKGCYEEIEAGWLFSIGGYKDNSYEDQPSYEVIETDGDITYVVVYPTDVQFDGASKKAQKRYQKMASQIEDVIATFQKK